MALDRTTILAQIDDLLEGYSRVKAASPHSNAPGAISHDELQTIATRLLAGIRRLSPPESEYLRRALAVEGYEGYVAEQLGGILMALRADVEAGYTESLTELVHADVFADFLAMADELQRKGFKDAAAVIAGSTLEEHLRKLAQKASLPITNTDGEPLKASRLNDDLCPTVYNRLEHRSVQSWLDIRNAAAHGKYDEYDHKQVAGMIQGVGDFMTRHSA